MNKIVMAALFTSIVGCGAQTQSSSSQLTATAAKIIYNCKVTKLNKRVLDSFGDDVTLSLSGPNSVVQLKSENNTLKLALGQRVYANAQHHSVPADNRAAFFVESPDVEVGYLFDIEVFGGSRTARLSGFTTDLAPGERIENRAEWFADLNCAK